MNDGRAVRCLLRAAPVLACLAVASVARAEFHTPLAVTHVTIVPAPGERIEDGTILMAEGRIVAVGRNVDIPPEAETVDAKGATAYAGFIDAATFLGLPSATDDVRSDEARIRVEDEQPDAREGPFAMTRGANRRGVRPQWRAMDVYTPSEKDLSAHRKAGFTAALIVPRDYIFGGSSDLMLLSDLPIRRAVLATDVALHGSFTIGEGGGYPRTLLGWFAQFRQVLLDAQWYARLRRYEERHPLSARRAPRDPALDALQPLLAGRTRFFFEANSEREIRRAIRLADEFDLRLVLTGGREAWKVADLLKEKHIPVVVSLKFDEEPEFGRKKDRRKRGASASKKDKPDEAAGSENEPGRSEPEQEKKKGEKKSRKKLYEPTKVRRERRRLWEEQVANLIRLHEAGIPVALRTRDLKKPSELWDNLRKVIERGLPESAALAAVTTGPAELFGMADRLGTLRPGALANVTLLGGPLAGEKTKVKMVFIEGKRFEIEKEKDKPGKKSKPRDREKQRGREGSGTSSLASEDEPEEGAPTFETEIKADRIPKTHTGGNVLIEHATILPVTAPTLTDASLLILDGKIRAIGRDIEAPPNVTRIDATGRFVIPGFVDAHSHLGLDAVNEWPLAISAEVRIADVINPTSVAIYRAVAGGTTTHHTMHGSANPIGGQNAIWKLKYGRPLEEMLIPDAPPTIKFALGENVTRANSPRERRITRFPNSRMGVEAVIRMAFEAARQYQREWDEYRRRSANGEDVPPPRRDLRLEALAKILKGELTVHAHCYRSDEILRLLRVAEDYGFRIGTLQHVLEGYRIAPEIARHGCGASTFSNFWAYKVEAYHAIPYNAALMTRHGINVSINSDSPNTIRYFGQEAAKCIKWGGLSENEALRLVTINPAMQLQIDHRIGSLEVGKDGDVAIFNGHPLNTFSKCIMTLIDGEVYFEDDRPDPVEPCATLPIPANVDRTIPKTPHRAYAIVGATIHPVSGPVIEHGTVVIVEDRIHAVGPDVPVPPGAGVIRGEGLHVYPGLIDAGSTLGLAEIGALPQTRDNRDIATFAPHLRARSAIHSHSEHIRIARTVGITTALTKPSGSRIAGQSAIIHLDGWTADEMAVVDAYGLHMTVPSLPARLPDDRKRREKMKKDQEKAMDELEKFLARAKHYARVKKLAERNPDIHYERDVRLEAMVPYVRGEKPVVFNAHSYKHILDTIEFAEKHGLRCVISGGTGAWKLAKTLAEKDVPVILGTPLRYPWGEFEPWDAVYRCAAVLDKAGVRFCFASESAAGAYNLPIEAGMAVAHGLPRERAEYALTLGAARILGIDDRVGSIEPGKIADLVVTTDTPLQTVSQVTHLFIAGRPVELTSMHTEEYEKFKNRPEPVLPPLRELVGPPNLTAGAKGTTTDRHARQRRERKRNGPRSLSAAAGLKPARSAVFASGSDGT